MSSKELYPKVISSHVGGHRNKILFVMLDWVQPPLMVDVGVKGISRMQFNCSLALNVFLIRESFGRSNAKFP